MISIDYDSNPELFELTLSKIYFIIIIIHFFLNIELLANGNDISSETFRNERILYYQKKTVCLKYLEFLILTTISLTLLDQYGNEIPVYATDNQPIEFFIPRDLNLILPGMILQNVISKSSEKLFYINLNQFIINNNLTVSLHFCPRKSMTNPPILDEPVNFTSNFELRIYSSGCYYLDKYNNWQSDGLWVKIMIIFK